MVKINKSAKISEICFRDIDLLKYIILEALSLPGDL